MTIAVLCWTSAVAAAPLASYDAGVAPAPGNAGAANPTTQGWIFDNGNVVNQFAAGYDSGDGGWRTVDGTTTAPAFYQQNLTAAQAEILNNNAWKLDFTLSMDSDAKGSSGGFVDNYYLPPNNGRQNDIVAWVETTTQRYTLTFNIDSSSNLFANDGTTNHKLTTDGSAYDNFKSMRILYDGAAATLNFNNQSFALGTLASLGNNRVVFGASSSTPQGSAIWNRFSLVQVVPEPGTFALSALGLAGLGGIRRRRIR